MDPYTGSSHCGWPTKRPRRALHGRGLAVAGNRGNTTAPSRRVIEGEEKIRSKMITRLRKDDYISKLLNDEDDNNNKTPTPVRLAQAKIQVHGNDLEERVDVTENICEAVKRAVWSSAESPLEAVEVLMQFPCLPTTVHESLDAKTPLANRAKLRLLEDAMVDACEQEGDEEIIDDLKISSKEEGANGNGGKSRKKQKAR